MDTIRGHSKLDHWITTRKKHMRVIYDHVMNFPISETEEVASEEGVSLKQFL